MLIPNSTYNFSDNWETQYIEYDMKGVNIRLDEGDALMEKWGGITPQKK